MFSNFQYDIDNVVYLNGGMMNAIIQYTDNLTKLIQSPNLTEMVELAPNQLVPGRFYIIQYNFNGNFIWCPILALEYKVHNNNHILYAVNLEYLPVNIKIAIFDKIFKATSNEIESNIGQKDISNEPAIKILNFKNVYSILKSNKLEFAITAFTIMDSEGELKIKKTYLCSMKIAPSILLSDFKKLNSISMQDMIDKLEGPDEDKMKKILEEYNKFIEDYQMDSIAYHKQYAAFRDKLKLK